MYTRLGEDVEAMNAAMENLPPEERVNAILTGLTGHGVAEAYEKFIKDEADLVAEQKAVENLSLKWAELAAELSPIVTDIMNSLGMVVDDMSDFVRKAKEKGFIAAVFDEAFGVDDTGNSDLFDKDGNLNPAVGEAWGLTPAEIDAYNAVHAGDNRKAEEEADWAAEARRIMERAKQTREGNIFPGVAFPAFSDDASITVIAKKDGMTYGESYFSGFREALDGLIDDSKSSMLPTYDEMMEAYFMGGADALKGWIDSLALSEEDRAAADEIMRSIGVESGTGFDEGLKTSMNTAIENAKISGSNAAMGVGNGIAASSSYAVRQAWDMANGINAALASIGAGYNAPVIGRYGPSGNAGVYLDGKRVGEAIAPTVNASLGKTAGRLTKVG